MPAFSRGFLEIVRCPESGSPLSPAADAVVERLNRGVADGTLKNRGGQTISVPLDGGLIDQSASMCYPIRDGIVTLVVEEAIPLRDVPP